MGNVLYYNNSVNMRLYGEWRLQVKHGGIEKYYQGEVDIPTQLSLTRQEHLE